MTHVDTGMPPSFCTLRVCWSSTYSAADAFLGILFVDKFRPRDILYKLVEGGQSYNFGRICKILGCRIYISCLFYVFAFFRIFACQLSSFFCSLASTTKIRMSSKITFVVSQVLARSQSPQSIALLSKASASDRVDFLSCSYSSYKFIKVAFFRSREIIFQLKESCTLSIFLSFSLTTEVYSRF